MSYNNSKGREIPLDHFARESNSISNVMDQSTISKSIKVFNFPTIRTFVGNNSTHVLIKWIHLKKWNIAYEINKKDLPIHLFIVYPQFFSLSPELKNRFVGLVPWLNDT